MPLAENKLSESRSRVLRYLREHHVATLATRDAQGGWAAAVFYVNDGCTLYFLSSPSTRHCQNLVDDSRVAVTIHEDYKDWKAIKGVQLEGIARELAAEEERTARKLYEEKFAIVRQLAQAPAAIISAMTRVRWYKVVPQRLYFIDNSKGFGNRDEIDLGLEDQGPVSSNLSRS